MTETMFVRPAPGVRVRNPQNRQHIPESGAHVPRDQFWMRRLADGDVLIADEPGTMIATITAEKE